MKEWISSHRSNRKRRPKHRLAALGVSAISAFVPGGTPHELPTFDGTFVCDVARHRVTDPNLKDEKTVQEIIAKAYQLNRSEGFQQYYYFDLAGSNVGQPVAQGLENEIVDVEVQNDVIGLEFFGNHHQLYRDATAPTTSIRILTKNNAQPVENLPVVLYSRKMIVQEENQDRFYPLESRNQKIVDPDYSQDTELTRNYGVEVVRFCDIPGKGRIPVNAGYLDLRVFPVIFTKSQ
jgi:hypothetical protein